MPPDVIFLMTVFASIWMLFTIIGMIWFLACVEKYLQMQTELYKLAVSKNRREIFYSGMVERDASSEVAEKASIVNCPLSRMRENP